MSECREHELPLRLADLAARANGGSGYASAGLKVDPAFSEYDEDMSTMFARLVSVAYCSNATVISEWTCTRCQRVPELEPYEVVFDTEWDLVAYVGWHTALKAVTVVFRGTDSSSWGNWINNLRSWRASMMFPIPNAPKALVHSGFYNMWVNSALGPNITRAVHELLLQKGLIHPSAPQPPSLLLPRPGHPAAQQEQEQERRLQRSRRMAGTGDGVDDDNEDEDEDEEDEEQAGKGARREVEWPWSKSPPPPARPSPPSPLRLYVAGHSMGAALASLCALDLKFAYNFSDVHAFTYGSPRVGNQAFQQLFQEHVLESWRFTHNRDVVPSLPPSLIGFHHVAREVWQVDLELPGGIVEKKMLMCDDSGEDPSCHNSACYLGLCTSVADHLMYLGIAMYKDPLEC